MKTLRTLATATFLIAMSPALLVIGLDVWMNGRKAKRGQYER